jgi:hypothetical protein
MKACSISVEGCNTAFQPQQPEVSAAAVDGEKPQEICGKFLRQPSDHDGSELHREQ